MSNNGGKAPPAMRDGLSYENWKKEISIWQRFTKVEKKKQGLAIFLSLEGEARETVLDIPIDELDEDEGSSKVLAKLDKLYLKDKIHLAYQAYHIFAKFQRNTEMNMDTYINEFEKLYNKAKSYEMALPDGILAYELHVLH